MMSAPIDLARVRAALKDRRLSALERPRRAAVAVVLAEREAGLSVLLVERSVRAGDPWSGHMALPGGHEQPLDADLLQTARRETQEEVGLDLGAAELVGGLDDISPMRSSEIAVRPFVFWLERPSPLELSPEIAQAVWAPLADLAEVSRRTTWEVEIGPSRLRVPAYVIDERVVWGMTLRLLDDFLERLSVRT
jgi:8-oxo-dGTP pyrophosphatase MutT (NUDIX family)